VEKLLQQVVCWLSRCSGSVKKRHQAVPFTSL